jgi:phage-related protein
MAKPVHWMGSSHKDLKELPDEIQRAFGFALWEVQLGDYPRHARPLRGFGGSRVLELREALHGNAYRAVYTVRFAEAVYVLHVFQKKSKTGSALPQEDLDLIKRRLRDAERDHEQRQARKD